MIMRAITVAKPEYAVKKALADRTFPDEAFLNAAGKAGAKMARAVQETLNGQIIVDVVHAAVKGRYYGIHQIKVTLVISQARGHTPWVAPTPRRFNWLIRLRGRVIRCQCFKSRERWIRTPGNRSKVDVAI